MSQTGTFILGHCVKMCAVFRLVKIVLTVVLKYQNIIFTFLKVNIMRMDENGCPHQQLLNIILI